MESRERKTKCFIVKPLVSIKEVTNWLNLHHFSYYLVEEDNVIFANMAKVPTDLEEIAEVVDPVFGNNDQWCFQIPGDELSKTYDSEHKARCAFVNYISWVGENNAVNP